MAAAPTPPSPLTLTLRTPKNTLNHHHALDYEPGDKKRGLLSSFSISIIVHKLGGGGEIGENETWSRLFTRRTREADRIHYMLFWTTPFSNDDLQLRFSTYVESTRSSSSHALHLRAQ